MEFNNRKSVCDNLDKYDTLAKNSDYVEVTEWANGEGWDINFTNRSISLTIGELEAINYLIKSLDFNK